MDIASTVTASYLPHFPMNYSRKMGQAGWGNAQGGLARLAQARQNRPGKGELDLTNIRDVMCGRGCEASRPGRDDPALRINVDSARTSGYRDHPC
jgi:hypothetical protein